MAKTPYKPTAMLDPLAELRSATTQPTDQTRVPAVDESYSALVPSGADALGQQAPTETLEPKLASRLSVAPVKPLSTALKPSRNTVYLYPEDLTKLRQLSGYASSEHGIRANDSMIVRAALSLVESDVRFMHALKDAELSDRRRTK
jgi:hypothetical protein